MKIINYTIVSESSNDGFKKQIMYWIASGWQPYFAPFTSSTDNTIKNQVMVQYEDPKPSGCSVSDWKDEGTEKA